MATYNGWTNYKTWAVKLWMDNEEGSYRYWQDATRHARGDRSKLAEALQEEHEENMPELQGVYGDMLRAAFSEVNWYEIAENMLEDEDSEDDNEEAQAAS